MGQDGFASTELVLEPRWDGRVLELHYELDRRAPAGIRVHLPALEPAVLELIAVAGALYLGSLVLAARVRVAHPVRLELCEEIGHIGEMLYDIRRWRDGLPLGGPPQVTADEALPAKPMADHGVLDERASVLMWSGGKDSTLGLLALRENGYVVHPVHASVNAGAEEPERRAVEELAPLVGVDEVEVLGIEHPEFLELARAYSLAWDEFPLSNRVPFGRDLLLAVLAVPLALHRRAACVSLGHDAECRSAEVVYQGKRIPRNDLESSRAALLLEAALRRHVHPGLRLLPPVANLAELRILRDMFVDHPELMARTSFCFWGRSCGRCGKCLRYFLADRLYRRGLLSFQDNPLRAGACPELAELIAEPGTLFRREVMVLLGRLAQRGDIDPGEEELVRFRDRHLAALEPFLDTWEAELLATRRDPQVPPGFRPASAGASLLASRGRA